MKYLLPLIPAALAVQAIHGLAHNLDPIAGLLALVVAAACAFSAILLGVLVID